MSEYAELKARLAATPLCEGSGEETDLGEQAAAAIDALERQWDEHDAAWCERVRLLTEQLQAAEAKAKRLEEALRFYAEGEWPEDYPGGVLYAAGDDTDDFKTHIDYGNVARAALQEDKSHE